MEEIKKFKNIVIGAGPAGRLGSFELPFHKKLQKIH